MVNVQNEKMNSFYVDEFILVLESYICSPRLLIFFLSLISLYLSYFSISILDQSLDMFFIVDATFDYWFWI